MKKIRISTILLFLCIVFSVQKAHAFWMWTPETNKWINPKYSVRDTPQEQLDYAKSLFLEKKYKDAIVQFKRLIVHYPKAKEAPEAQYYLGQSYQALGYLYKAFETYQLVIDKYPFSNLAKDVVLKQYNIGVEILEGRKDSRNKFIGMFAGANYDVIEIFRTVIKNAPYGEYAAPSQYKIGLYLLEKNLFQEARDEFEKVINDYPESQWAKAAKYQIAISDASRSTEAQYDQKITQAAVQEFKEIAKKSPDVELSDQAKEQIAILQDKEAENQFLIAKFYEKQKNYQSAKVYYQGIVDHYKKTKWAKEALKKILEISKKIK